MAQESTLKKTAEDHLPIWNFEGLFSSHEDPKIQQILGRAQKETLSLQKNLQGQLTSLKALELFKAIQRYETLVEDLELVLSYAYLLYADQGDNSNVTRFYQNTYETVSALFAELVFFTLEINQIDEKDLQLKLKECKELTHYEPWLKNLRLYKPYELSMELEQFIQEKNVSSSGAFVRLFDEVLVHLRFKVDKKEDLTLSDALNYLQDPDRSLRKEAALALATGLEKHDYQFSLIMNTIAKDKAIEDKWRGFKSPISSRNLSNCVEDEVVDALLQSVQKAYPDLSHRYYKLKARLLGQDYLEYWDRNAPYQEQSEINIPWAKAKDIVLKAYHSFSPLMANKVQLFFDHNWVDAALKPGKRSGAFSHGMVPKTHPFILMSYHGKMRDVMTLAHELGHGVHQILAAKQGALMCNTPLTLAETASVFGEMLTFRSLLQEQTTKIEKRLLLASKIEDMLNTVVRQVAFCDFEQQIHGERLKGELTKEDISKIWMDIQQKSLGSAFRFDSSYEIYWAYISHFFHSPFYVYSYAFGDSLVNALYAVYENNKAGFAEKYIDLLEAGGTKWHGELLKPFGLNAKDPQFWQQGLSMISGFIDEFESTL
jgi:oligoendopeptidase F